MHERTPPCRLGHARGLERPQVPAVQSLSQSTRLWEALLPVRCTPYQEATCASSQFTSASVIKWGWGDKSSFRRIRDRCLVSQTCLSSALSRLGLPLHFFINTWSKFNPRPGPGGRSSTASNFKSAFLLLLSLHQQCTFTCHQTPATASQLLLMLPAEQS